MSGSCAKSKSHRTRDARNISKETCGKRAGKLKLLLAALILIAAFSINSYLALRTSLPAPIDYGAVYDSLQPQ